jgi:hypothetical protein
LKEEEEDGQRRGRGGVEIVEAKKVHRDVNSISSEVPIRSYTLRLLQLYTAL